MITFRQKGDFSKLTRYLERVKEVIRRGDLDKYGRAGVAALASATPIDTGLTASSWYYEIEHSNGSAVISFHNSNIQNGVPIAIIFNMATELALVAGWKGEITSIPPSGPFLMPSQMMHGGRLLDYEQNS